MWNRTSKKQRGAIDCVSLTGADARSLLEGELLPIDWTRRGRAWTLLRRWLKKVQHPVRELMSTRVSAFCSATPGATFLTFFPRLGRLCDDQQRCASAYSASVGMAFNQIQFRGQDRSGRGRARRILG